MKNLLYLPLLLCLLAASSKDNLKDVKLRAIININKIVVRKTARNSSRRYEIVLAGYRPFVNNDKVNSEALKYMHKKLSSQRFDIKYDKKIGGMTVVYRNKDFNETLIKEGLVERYKDNDQYVKAERSAKNQRNGNWKKDYKTVKTNVYDTISEEYVSNSITNSAYLMARAENFVDTKAKFEKNKIYNIRIYGTDTFHEKTTQPGTLYVYSQSEKSKKAVLYIIVGMDYKKAKALGPDDSMRVESEYMKHIKLKNKDKEYNIPVFKHKKSELPESKAKSINYN